MKNEQLYKETVDIILDAYNNKQLKSTDACGCFIGNIVAKRMEYPAGEYYNAAWYIVGWNRVHEPGKSISENGIFVISAMGTEEFIKLGELQIASTGYTTEEVMAMERAFERGSCKYYISGTVFNGMVAALKVLAKIHETKGDESLVRLEKIQKEKYSEVV